MLPGSVDVDGDSKPDLVFAVGENPYEARAASRRYLIFFRKNLGENFGNPQFLYVTQGDDNLPSWIPKEDFSGGRERFKYLKSLVEEAYSSGKVKR